MSKVLSFVILLSFILSFFLSRVNRYITLKLDIENFEELNIIGIVRILIRGVINHERTSYYFLICYHKNIQNTVIFYRYTYKIRKFIHLNICGLFQHFFNIQKPIILLKKDWIKLIVYLMKEILSLA